MVDEGVLAAVREALRLGRGRRFRQSVDLVVVLRDVDLRSPEARLREIVYLPHEPRKSVRVCVVADGDMAVRARELGLRVIDRAELSELRGDRKRARRVAEECDWVLVRADLMGLAGAALGPVLGPRGSAPVPVPPNADIGEVAARMRRAVWVRVRNQPQVMCRVGTEDNTPEEIAENIEAVINTITSRLGQGKIARVYVKRTMGIPVAVEVS